jgi:hypothetical protein
MGGCQGVDEHSRSFHSTPVQRLLIAANLWKNPHQPGENMRIMGKSPIDHSW